MTPQARAQAAIELLDEVIAAARSGGAAADTLIARYFKERRYAGSKDRRAVRECVYAAIRRAGEVPASGRAALLGLAQDDPALLALFDGSAHAPARPAAGEPVAAAGVAPGWLVDRFAASGLATEEQVALLARAPLDVRVNRLKATREEVLATLRSGTPTTHAPHGVRLPEGTRVEDLSAFRDGLVEVQDEGSQLVADLVGALPGSTVVDLCAGAGGKTLALAAAMANQGRLVACDVDRTRLARLAPRAERAGATLIEARLLDGGREEEGLRDLRGMADAVLVDAPCSGTGTWRRNPEARWRLTPERLARVSALQARILDFAAPLVRPGGALVHVVCSLLDEEGADQVDRFLAAHRGWEAEPLPESPGTPRGQGARLTPRSDGTDGFFVARLRAPC